MSLFRNKTLQLRVVDANRPYQSQLNAGSKRTTPPETAIIEVVRESSKYIAGLVATYMAADTVRQILIYTVVTKIK